MCVRSQLDASVPGFIKSIKIENINDLCLIKFLSYKLIEINFQIMASLDPKDANNDDSESIGSDESEDMIGNF